MAATDSPSRLGREDRDEMPAGPESLPPARPDLPFAEDDDLAGDADAPADPPAAENSHPGDSREESLVEPREPESERRRPAPCATRLPARIAGVAAEMRRRLPLMGELADASPDTMTLHTRDAYRLFTGRPADPRGGHFPIPGGRRFASIVNSLWRLSANDNPYADWILVMICEDLAALRADLRRAIGRRKEVIERLKRQGTSLAIMASRDPKTVPLDFRSPYGYAMAEVVREFDYHVRIIKTLVYKDHLSDEEGRAAIRTLGRKMRALFVTPIRWQRLLLRKDLRRLRRSDYLPNADELARERVRVAVGLFGEVPRKVFTGATAPRHTRRRVKLTDGQLQLLEEVSLAPTEDEQQLNTELL